MEAKTFFLGKGMLFTVAKMAAWFFSCVFILMIIIGLLLSAIDIKPYIEKFASAVLNQSVGIEGDVDVKIFSASPYLKIRNATIGDLNIFALDLSLKEGGVHAQGEIENLPYNLVFESATGTAQSYFDLTSTGTSSKQLRENLSGEIKIIGGLGQINESEFNLFSAVDQKSNLHCLNFDLIINRGMAKVERLIIDTDKKVITGSGSIDLAQSMIDIRLVPHQKTMHLTSFATPMLLQGSFSDLTLKPDPKTTIDVLGKTMMGIFNPFTLLTPFGTQKLSETCYQSFLSK